MTIKQALQIVISESNNEYAKTYAQAGLDLGGATEGEVKEGVSIYSKVLNKVIPSIVIETKPTGKMMVGEELKTQILYILSNLGGWKGERAREIKKVLKKVIK